MNIRKKIWGKLLEIIITFVLIILSFTLAFYLRIGGLSSSDFTFRPFLELAFLVTPVFIFLLSWGGIFSFRQISLLEKLRIISISCLGGSMFFVLVFFFNREIFFSRLIVLLIFLLSTFLIWFFYLLLYFQDKLNWKKQKNISRVLIIGANKAAEKVILHFQKNISQQYPFAILAPYGCKKKDLFSVPVLGKLNALEKVVKEKNINEIIQCDGVEQSLNILNFCEGNFLNFKISPEILGAFQQNIFSENIAGKSFLSLEISPLFGWGQFFKRCFDFIISLLLLLFLSPFFIIVFLYKKFKNPQKPVFENIEKARGFEEKFNMIRFNTNKNFQNNNFLEKTFFKNLPELFNVLKGQMSLVGPRPCSVEEREKMPLNFKKRLVLKPGMTGQWQIKFLQNKESNFTEMIIDDIAYIQNWNFKKDLWILFLTIKLIIKKFK